MKKAASLILILVVLVTFGFTQAEEDSPVMQLHQVDVGCANAYLLLSGETVILIECGINWYKGIGDTPDKLMNYIASTGIDHYDAHFITHWHNDHCLLMPELSELYGSDSSSVYGPSTGLPDFLSLPKGNYCQLKAGESLEIGPFHILCVAPETIRRDLKEMEEKGELIRTHGGAYLIEKYDKGYPIELRKSYLQHTKEQLAETAFNLTHENDVVMLDSSTTCLAIAQIILTQGIAVTLITNSLEVCNLFGEANSNINLICVGGTFRRRTSSFADPNTVEALRRYYADKAFISCPKVSAELGLSDNHISEANVRKQMLKNAQKRFLVVDHTKFEGTANILFEGLESVDVLITDQKLPEEWESFAQRHGIELRYAAE